MTNRIKVAAIAAVTSIACMSLPALADEHPYSEGPVVNVARIRTVDGKTDEYLNWLATDWKKQEEASKKAGYILSYQVLTVEPRGPDDADVILVTTYKNWAALDGAIEKGDAIANQVAGSVAAANHGQAARSSIRRILGSATMQVLNLK